MDNAPPESCSTRCGGWRLPAILLLVLAAIALMQILSAEMRQTAAEVEQAEVAAGDTATRDHVSLSIDFGDGQRRDFDKIAWRAGMTVADLLRAAPKLAITQRGDGSSAFLTAIGDVKNEGAEGKNWTYEVNGETADRSFAIRELGPNDRVLWKFGPRP